MPRTKSALSCPECRLPVEEHLQFCHNCGLTISDDMTAAFPRGIDRSLLPKQSALPSAVVGAACLLAAAVAVIMTITIYDFVHQYGIPGGADVTQRSENYIRSGLDERAINLLEESLKLQGSDKRAAQWHALLDQALYNRGKKLAAEGKFRDAVTAFSRVSPTSSAHDEVEKLIAEYTDKGLPAVFGKVDENETKTDEVEAVEREKQASSRIQKAVMTAVPGGKGHLSRR